MKKGISESDALFVKKNKKKKKKDEESTLGCLRCIDSRLSVRETSQVPPHTHTHIRYNREASLTIKHLFSFFFNID